VDQRIQTDKEEPNRLNSLFCWASLLSAAAIAEDPKDSTPTNDSNNNNNKGKGGSSSQAQKQSKRRRSSDKSSASRRHPDGDRERERERDKERERDRQQDKEREMADRHRRYYASGGLGSTTGLGYHPSSSGSTSTAALMGRYQKSSTTANALDRLRTHLSPVGGYYKPLIRGVGGGRRDRDLDDVSIFETHK